MASNVCWNNCFLDINYEQGSLIYSHYKDQAPHSLCRTMACFHVIFDGDYPCAHHFLWKLSPVYSTFMFHVSL